MPIQEKHVISPGTFRRDVRPVGVRLSEFWSDPDSVTMVMLGTIAAIFFFPEVCGYIDLWLFLLYRYFKWIKGRSFSLPFKFPKNAGLSDSHNPAPGKSGSGKSEGIMFLGNYRDKIDKDNNKRELWLTNSDIRTHFLYIGTTGSGKTEGLKSMVTNALTWGSGFVYVDGKADTDLWASLFALARRFGRDDDLLVLNYMTANSDDGATSNTMNPFANGSASYLSNMVTSLMPDAGGDNAMWKERAIALMSALMPALTWKRDKQGLLLDVGVMRDFIELKAIIALSRDQNLPERIILGLQGYLNTLPGYTDAAFDDEGNERPPAPDQPMYDMQVARQQHGYLSMQFTRALQSLADEYGYIFKAQLADIDILDVVLNRRILVGLIPALEKSTDEAANLGKIIVACLKGMMGATLGNAVEGSWETAIGSKQTRAASSFMTVFDEVGYYTAPGMAVMAAQARSLGFSLIFAAQDLPSMEKRIKQEAQSILANCNIKIFGKLEDPTETAEFLEKHAGKSYVMEMSGMSAPQTTVSSLFMNQPFVDPRSTGSPIARGRASYDGLRAQREGETHIFYAEYLAPAKMFRANPERVNALRVHRFLPVPGTTTSTAARERAITEMSARLKDPKWKAISAQPKTTTAPDLAALFNALETTAEAPKALDVQATISALIKFGDAPVQTKPTSLLTDSEEKPKFSAAPKEEKNSFLPPSMGAGNWATDYKNEEADDFEEEMEIPSASPKTAAAPSKKAEVLPTSVNPEEMRARGEIRATLPPLQEGDQFTITELENIFVAETDKVASEIKPGTSHALSGISSYGPREADVHAVAPHADTEGDSVDLSLPSNLEAFLKASAQKINEGLSEEE